jgi:hypothetical protein
MLDVISSDLLWTVMSCSSNIQLLYENRSWLQQTIEDVSHIQT